MDDVRDLVLGDRVRRPSSRSVMSPRTKRHALELLRLAIRLQPPAVVPEVERDDGRALADERGDRPGAEAAERAGDEPAAQTSS